MGPRPEGYLPSAPLPVGSVPGVSWSGVKAVCGREVVEVLPGGRSVRCRGLSGEGDVVIKPLPRDCLIRPHGLPVAQEATEHAPAAQELHAHVRDRLLRVRELADVDVANLCGVEEDAALGAMLIWQWVPGRDLPSLPADWEAGTGGLLRLAWRLTSAVERLHLLGIVHGRLHLRNVIVTARDEIVLTHVSPLVVDDPDRDASDLVRMLRELNARPRESWQARGETAVLARVLAEAGTSPRLEDLREKLTRAGGTRYIAATPGRTERPSRSRVWAAVLVVVAVGLGLVLSWLTGRSSPPRLTIPEVQTTAGAEGGVAGEGPR
jgi:hypothetical protein